MVWVFCCEEDPATSVVEHLAKSGKGLPGEAGEELPGEAGEGLTDEAGKGLTEGAGKELSEGTGMELADEAGNSEAGVIPSMSCRTSTSMVMQSLVSSELDRFWAGSGFGILLYDILVVMWGARNSSAVRNSHSLEESVAALPLASIFFQLLKKFPRRYLYFTFKSSESRNLMSVLVISIIGAQQNCENWQSTSGEKTLKNL